MSVSPIRSLALSATLVASLGACATPFNADVARFQQLPAPQGQSFAIVASDPELKGGLEFSQYAGLVASELTKVGYTPASDTASADLIVSMSYDVDNGRERVRSNGGGFGGYGGFGGPFGGGFYGRRGFYGRPFGYGFYDPFIYGAGYNDVESYTVYTSELDLKIDRRVDDTRLFEGKAEAMSRSKRLPYLVPNLVEAMFTEFPGSSGETVRISIAPEKTTVRDLR